MSRKKVTKNMYKSTTIYSIKYILLFHIKVLKDTENARREINLHWRACQECNNILKIVDIYIHETNSIKSLCVITELMAGGELFDKIIKKKDLPFTERGRLKFNMNE